MASEDEKPPELKIVGAISTLVAIGLIAVCFRLAIDDKFANLAAPTKASDLKSFSDKLEFTAQFWALHGLWFFIAMMNVGKGRARARAGNPLAG